MTLSADLHFWMSTLNLFERMVYLKISEVLLRVSENGDLCIPRELLQEMGLSPCDPVYLAYLTKDREENSYQEFLLSPNSIENKEDEQKILIPTPLLEQANLDLGEDIQILCLDKAILLYEALELERKDLEAILQQLQLANELGSLLPGEANSAILQLEQIIQEGVNDYETAE